MAGALASSLVWSLGWAARRFLFPPESRLKWGDSGGSDDDEESSTSISDEADFSRSSKSKLARWPWETLRNSVINMSTSFLNVDGVGYESHQDDDVSVAADSKTGPCIGEIFGLDVGGTLTKLVYFEQEIVEYKRQESHEGLHRREHYNAAASALEVLQARRSASMMFASHTSDSDSDLQGLWGMRQESVPDRLDEFAACCNIDAPLSPEGEGNATRNGHDQSKQPQEVSPGMGMRKSRSMINVSKSTEHAEALDNFYSFARRLDSYDTSLKDKHLSYYSRFLNGTFHFIRFETRQMNHAIKLMRYNNFHRNIKEIGATGETFCHYSFTSPPLS